MELTKKEVKSMKGILIIGILNQMQSEYGYELILGGLDEEPRKVLVVDRNTEYIPDHWGAGITNGMYYRFGDTLARVEFASEEAKRKVRNMFPAQAKFITWAWYN
ncbi:MAG: hypothetical protein ABIG87_00875 [Patescibacteria group bacterium]